MQHLYTRLMWSCLGPKYEGVFLLFITQAGIKVEFQAIETFKMSFFLHTILKAVLSKSMSLCCTQGHTYEAYPARLLPLLICQISEMKQCMTVLSVYPSSAVKFSASGMLIVPEGCLSHFYLSNLPCRSYVQNTGETSNRQTAS